MDQKPTLTASEAAAKLGISVMTISRLWREGYLTGYKLNPDKRNSPLRIYAESVEELLNKRQQ